MAKPTFPKIAELSFPVDLFFYSFGKTQTETVLI